MDLFNEARKLMDQHGLSHWKLRWAERGSAVNCARCYGGKRLITFNRMYVVMTKDERVLRNTILHEIAHALQYERQGYGSHDAAWKEIALSIGCDGKRCNADAVLPKRGRVGLYKCGTSIEED